MIAAKVTGVTVHAGAAQLLGPIDLELVDGEHLLLVGASGCGKTTLLRVLSGLATPSAGTVELFGRSASTPGKLLVPPEKREVGMLFQGGALWPHMSVRKTLRFVLCHAGAADVERRITELVQRVHLDGLEDRKPATLSGGEKQRLALARALAMRPRLLLLDEPLGPLDAELRESLLQRIDSIQREQNLTLIHVTHDPEESKQYADRTIRMVAGKIESDQRNAAEGETSV